MANRFDAYNIGFDSSGKFDRRPADPGHLESDDFYINDVVLRISPENININQTSYSHSWKTLRTRQSRHSKTGYGVARVTITKTFQVSNYTDEDNLARVVAGLRATPFCVVYNKYLEEMLGHPDHEFRSSDQRGSKVFRPIMLAMSSMSFSTMGSEGKPDCILATLDFIWFNYLPFTDFVAFKAGDELDRPGHAWESTLWQSFYAPFYNQQKPVKFPHREADTFSRTTRFMWREFLLVPTGHPAAIEASQELVNALQKKPQVMMDLLEEILEKEGGLESGEIEPTSITPQVVDALYRRAASKGIINLNDEVKRQMASIPGGSISKHTGDVLVPALRDMFGTHKPAFTTNSLDHVSATLGERLKKFRGTQQGKDAASDALTAGKYKEVLKVQAQEGKEKKKYDAGGFRLYGRKNYKNIIHQNKQDYFDGPDAIIEQILVSFRNDLAMIPISQYRYPTIQHIGSIDAHVTFTINARNSGAADLSAMYRQVESTSLSFKQVPAGFTNINIRNDFLSLFGLTELLPDSIGIAPIPGQPGRSLVNMSMVEAGITSRTRLEDPEELNQEFIFSHQGVKKTIFQIMWKDTINNSGRDTESFTYRRKTSGVSKDNRNTAYRSLVEEMVEIFNDFMVQVYAAIIPRSVVEGEAAYAILHNLKEDDPLYGYIPGIKVVESNMRKVRKAFERERPELKDRKFGSVTLPPQRELHDRMGINRYVRDMAALISKIERTQIHLKQFERVLKMKEGLGLNKGLLAYPDFRQQLSSVAGSVEQVKANDNKVLIKYDPDCYFYYPTYNGGSNSNLLGLIDPSIIAAAKSHSQKIVKNAHDSINKYFKGTYLNRLKNDGHPGPHKVLTEDYGGTELTDFLYKDKEFTNSLSAEKISVTVVCDADAKSPTNWYGAAYKDSGPTLNPYNSGPACTHSTNIDTLFDGAWSNPSPGSSVTKGSDKHANDQTPGLNKKGAVNPKDVGFVWPVKPPPGVLPPGYRFGAARKYRNGTHGGIDMPEPNRGDRSNGPNDGIYGTLVYAAADGVVSAIKHLGRVGGLFIQLYHKGGWRSEYFHLLEGSIYVRKGQQVEAGKTKIARIGRTGNRNSYTHLHFQIRTPDQKKIDPESVLPQNERRIKNARRYNPKDLDKFIPNDLGRDPTSVLSSPINEAIREFEKDIYNGQAQSMMRAYPAFKLYFIEDDSSEARLAFDDFFSYHAVQSIRVVRSRKIAADLCEIYLTNISGALSNRKFRHHRKGDQPFTSTGKPAGESPRPMNAGTAKENPIASLLLQEGIQISLRMGYTNDPQRMPTVFNGLITGVQFSESDDLVRIVAQSHAIELIQDIKGVVKPQTKTSFSAFGWKAWGFDQDATTGRILEEMMAQPEVLHFGRWLPNKGGQNPVRELLTQRWTFNPQPADDNIFAPSPDKDMNDFGSDWKFKNLQYVIYKTTIWDIFQEMTLRHPNFIASPVPYEDENSQRSTMFFGLPNQLYFARHPNLEEQLAEARLRGIQEEHKNKYVQTGLKSRFRKFGSQAEVAAAATKLEKAASNFFRESRLKLARKAGYIKPFRNYHLLTSSHHIVANNIQVNSRDVANTITIEYQKNAPIKTPLGTTLTAKSSPITFTLKLDNSLPTEDIRTQVGSFVNVTHPELAKRYALALLCRNLRDAYKGEIVILGNPSIKPYNVCYLMDEYSDMVGAFEVEEVQHVFDQQHGFRTEIKPDMLVQASEISLLGSAEALGIVMEGYLRKLRSAGAKPAPFSLGPYIMGHAMDSFGGFLAQKIINYTQLAQPVIMSPLQHHGRMFTGGIPIRKMPDSKWSTAFGEWSPEMEKGYSDWLHDKKEEIWNWAKKVTFQHTVGDFWDNGGEVPE